MLWRAKSGTRPCLHHQRRMRTLRKLQTPTHCWPNLDDKTSYNDISKTNSFSFHIIHYTINLEIITDSTTMGEFSEPQGERLP